jgi:uncharacterized Tic20 family protein
MAKTNKTPESPEDSNKGTQAEQPVEAGKPATKEPEVSKDARMWAMFCHLAGLAGYIMPVAGNIIGPLILWQIKKDEYPFVDEQGKEAVNFQISMSLYALISIPLFFVCIGPFLLAAVGIVDLVLLIIATIKANNGEHYRYPLTIRFIK